MKNIIPVSDWNNSARRLASGFDPPFHPVVQTWLNAHPGCQLGVACSGGADSLALLLLVWARLRKTHTLRVLHFNHRIRGEAAERDAALVGEVAESLELPMVSGEAKNKPGKLISEERLRVARLTFFAEQDCVAIALGHQANDVAETLLMRLCRGSGVSGLAAPQPVSKPHRTGPVHLRPLLSVNRNGIEQALIRAGIRWQEDASNQSSDYFRNRVRKSIWPDLANASPTNALTGALRSRELLAEDAAALESWADSLGIDLDRDALEATRLRGAPKAIWRRSLNAWLAARGLNRLSTNAVDMIVTQWHAGETFRVSAGVNRFIECDQTGTLRVNRRTGDHSFHPQRIAVGAQLALPNRRWFQSEFVPLTNERRTQVIAGQIEEQTTAFLRWEEDEPRVLLIRLWEPGDRFHPLGGPGSRKLHDCFVDRKIPAWERKRIPVVSDLTGTILWVPGLPPSENRRLLEDSNSALWLTYRGC